MRKILLTIGAFILIAITCVAQGFQSFFYLSSHPGDPVSAAQQLEDFRQHANLVDVIAPRWYVLDAAGNLNGAVNAELLQIAQQHNVKVMPYIVNLGPGFDFNQYLLHIFLQSPSARQRAITTMTTLCDKYHLYGFQLDFENIHISDKDRYSQFVADASNALHQHNCLLSLAVMPRTSDVPTSERERRAFTNWLGAYDFKKLGQHADFISVMTYNRNGAGTTPGPNSPLSWTTEVVKYLIKYMPSQKVSIGLIDFSNYWYMDDKNYKHGIRARSTSLEYSKVTTLLSRWQKQPFWDADCGCYVGIHSQHGFYDYLFIEDVNAFNAKMSLIKQYDLRGFSLFRLGYEDPKIWDALSKTS